MGPNEQVREANRQVSAAMSSRAGAQRTLSVLQAELAVIQERITTQELMLQRAEERIASASECMRRVQTECTAEALAAEEGRKVAEAVEGLKQRAEAARIAKEKAIAEE